MPATRRTVNGAASPTAAESTEEDLRSDTMATHPTQRSSRPSHVHAGLPTLTEAVLLSIYPATLVLGSLFSHLSPSLRPPNNESTYSAAHQSFQPPEAAPSYFAQKRNVFNVYFVKIGWFWCTLGLALFTAVVGRGRFAAAPSSRLDPGARAFFAVFPGGTPQSRAARILQVVLRWAFATAVWTLTTQWCFGPPLIDRGFSLTGGACLAGIEHLAELDSSSSSSSIHPSSPGARAQRRLEKALTHAACSAAGGSWTGGWDISGHVFLLVLGSGMLWFEILPFVRRWSGHVGTDQRVVARPDGSSTTVKDLYRMSASASTSSARAAAGTGKGRPSGIPYALRAYALTFTLAIAVLSWWMLLMTAAFFHTWFEKLVGCLVAFAGLWATYYLPRAVPALREIVGMPGL